MPLYFAYGANLDRADMARRCPDSSVVGPAHLVDHRFIIMAAGYATLLPAAGAIAHGLLWEVAATDFPALDAFEEIDAGLYRRTARPVTFGVRRLDAAIYLAAESRTGVARPGYMEAILAAAERSGLPASYRAELRTWLKVA